MKLIFVILSSISCQVNGIFHGSCQTNLPWKSLEDQCEESMLGHAWTEVKARPARVWSFEMRYNIPPFGVLDEKTMEVVGLTVDVMRAVCEIANQRCVFAFNNDLSRCWSDETQSSAGLDNGWFDACPLYVKNPERALMYAFSRPYLKGWSFFFYIRISDNMRIQDLMGDNNISIGFERNTFISPECLVLNGLTVNRNLARFYNSFSEMFESLEEEEVRMIITIAPSPNPDQFIHMDLEGVEVSCSDGGNRVMTRKDNVELLEWVNPALDELIQSDEYTRICYVWSKIFNQQINCFDNLF